MISILVAERRAYVRETIRARLSRLGLHAIEACDDETASRCMERMDPVLVIVGCSASAGCTGDPTSASLDLVRWIRRNRPGLPVLFFATDSSEALEITARKAGV